jgi:hypothetical protein
MMSGHTVHQQPSLLTVRGELLKSKYGFMDYYQGIDMNINSHIWICNSVNQQDIKIKTREYV